MSNERALGSHLGYLAYHIEALRQRDDDLADKLATIRTTTDDKDEQIRKERSALTEYHRDVERRLEKLEKQVDDCFEDAEDTTRDRATEIKESAISAHLDEPDVPDDGFQTANDL